MRLFTPRDYKAKKAGVQELCNFGHTYFKEVRDAQLVPTPCPFCLEEGLKSARAENEALHALLESRLSTLNTTDDSVVVVAFRETLTDAMAHSLARLLEALPIKGRCIVIPDSIDIGTMTDADLAEFKKLYEQAISRVG